MAAGQANRSQRPNNYSNGMWDAHQEVLERLSRGGGISFGGFPHLHAERAAEEVERQERQGALELQRRRTRTTESRSGPSDSLTPTNVIPGGGQNQPIEENAKCLSCGNKKCDGKRPSCGNCAKATTPRKCIYPARPISTNDPRIQHMNPLILGPILVCFLCNRDGQRCNGDKPCDQCKKRSRGEDCIYSSLSLAVPDRATTPCERCQNSKRTKERQLKNTASKYEPCGRRLPACQHCCFMGLEVARDCTYSAQARTEASKFQAFVQEGLDRDQADNIQPNLFAQGNLMVSPPQPHSGPTQGTQTPGIVTLATRASPPASK